jgi:hypothetical protein
MLSIDAWAGVDEFSWEWNNWYKAGSIEIVDLNDNDGIKTALIEQGFIRSGAMDLIDLDDDQMNIVVVDKATREPLFAIEYGR